VLGFVIPMIGLPAPVYPVFIKYPVLVWASGLRKTSVNTQQGNKQIRDLTYRLFATICSWVSQT
jgi:hypothetical protein